MRLAAFSMATTLSLFLATSVVAEETSPADFEKYCDAMEGRWRGDVTFVADWPGLGKRGEKTVAFLDCKRTDDGRGLSIRFFGGAGSASGFAAYDAVSKKIRESFVVSGGYFGQREVVIDGDGFKISGKGSLPDGREHTVTIRRKLTNDGKEMVNSISGMIAGEPTDDTEEHWQKVSGKNLANADAKDFKTLGDLLAGRWVRDIVYVHDWKGAIGGRGAKARGYHEYQWINDGHALREVSFDGENRGENLLCLDPVTNRILGFGTGATGGVFVGTWQRLSATEWKLVPLEGGTGDGAKFGGSLTFKFVDDGKRIETSGVITLDGKPLDELQDVYHRVSP